MRRSWFTNRVNRPRSERKRSAENRRNFLLEVMEPRLMMSADSLISFANGVAAVAFGDPANSVQIRLASPAADGFVRLNLIHNGQSLLVGTTDTGVRELHLTGGSGDDQFDLSELLGVQVSVDGGGGTDSLLGPANDNRWLIDGPNAGSVGAIGFASIERLIGAANTNDTFVLGSFGSVSGILDGGAGGFDSLEIAGGDGSSVVFTATGPHSGFVQIDGTALHYDGLEPITLAGAPTDVVVDASAGDDLIVVEDMGGGTIRVRSDSLIPTFESVAFTAPTLSLTVNGLGGYDRISVAGSINLGSATFTARGESITVPAGAALTAGAVTLTAQNQQTSTPDPVGLTNDVIAALGLPSLTSPTDLLTFDPSTITVDPAAIASAINPASYLGAVADVTVQGQITTTGNIAITAEANNELGLAITGNTLAFRYTEALVALTGATLVAGGDISAVARNQGPRGALVQADKTVVNIAVDRTSATIEGGSLTANAISLGAISGADYAATGAKAINLVDGFTRAAVAGGAVLTAGIGGITISATEQGTIAAESSGNGKAAGALNYTDKDTTATVAASTLTATGGAVSVSAAAAGSVTARSVIAPPPASGSTSENPPTPDAKIHAVNVVQGGITASVTGGSVTATGLAGNITVDATNDRTVSAVIDATVTSSGGGSGGKIDVRSKGNGVAANIVGYEVADVMAQPIDSLIGDPTASSIFAPSAGSGTHALVTDTPLTAGGAIAIQAISTTSVEATLSNVETVTLSGTTTRRARPIATGEILAMNMLLSPVEAGYVGTAATVQAQAGAGMSVLAEDKASILADITVAAELDTETDAALRVQAKAGAISVNFVQGGATARIERADVQLTGGALSVIAREAATITANTYSEVEAISKSDPNASGPIYGQGMSRGASSTVAINAVLATATAEVVSSTVTAAGASGDVTVQADNTAGLSAFAVNAATATIDSDSTKTAATRAQTMTLAVNMLGFQAPDIRSDRPTRCWATRPPRRCRPAIPAPSPACWIRPSTPRAASLSAPLLPPCWRPRSRTRPSPRSP